MSGEEHKVESRKKSIIKEAKEKNVLGHLCECNRGKGDKLQTILKLK